MTLEFRLLGPLEFRRDGVVVPLRAAKQRLVLTVLLLNAGRVVSTDRLLEDVWGDAQPGDARHALEAHVSKLRHALGPSVPLVARPPGYLLDVEPRSVDVFLFEQLLAEARDAQASDASRAASRAARALALWRGPALADFAYDTFAQPWIARLEDLRLEALEERVEAELALGRAADLVAELEAVVGEHPLRERLVGHLMLALYRCGRGPDALAVFRRTRAALADELGLEPGPELRERERAILRQEASLASAPTRVAAGRRLVTVVALEPVAPAGLDVETHELEVRRASNAMAAVAADYGAVRTEPFLFVLSQEDHTVRAASFAFAVRDAVALPLRGGIESGEAVVTRSTAFGPVVNAARMLAAHAAEGAVLAGASARRALEPVAELAATETDAFLLVRVDVAAAAADRDTDGPFVDRVEELARLRSLSAAGSVRTALLLGPPGIGKSRLARRLADATDARVAFARCSGYGTTALEPLESLADQLGSCEAIAQAPAAEVAATFRRLCEEAAAARPLLLVVDDLQWADDLVLEAIEHLGARATGPILVLGLARDDALEERPSLLEGAERLVLGQLPDREVERLAASLAPLDAAARAQAVAAADGNPLFLEQLLAHAAEGVDTLPPTLRSLLTARLDLLGAAERAVIECAAVVGREFDAATVTDLLQVTTVDRSLAALVRRELLEPRPAVSPFSARYRIRHGLIQEAAYDAATKARRAELHERLADQLEARDADPEVVGFHLERAATLRPEPGRYALRLAEDAGRRLGRAGIGRWKRGDAGAAVRLLARAVALLPVEDEQRRELLCELGIAWHTAGETDRADAVLHEAVETATFAHDRRIELRARIELEGRRLLDGAAGAADALLALADRTVPLFQSLDDDRSLGRVLMLTGWVRGGMRCRNVEWQTSAEQALRCYRRAGWPPATCVGHIAAALYHGPTPAPDAIRRCRELLEGEVDDRAGEANVLAYLGGLVAMRGDVAEASALVERATEIYAELARAPTIASTCAPIAARIHLLAGNLEAAEHALRASCEELGRVRNRNALATQAAQLADVVHQGGRAAEAQTWLELAEESAVADDVVSQVAVRSVRAKLLAVAGDVDRAEQLAREAVALIATTDALDAHAAALLDLADVLVRCGRADEAAAARGGAMTLYARKGDVAAADAARRALQTAPAARAPFV